MIKLSPEPVKHFCNTEYSTGHGAKGFSWEFKFEAILFTPGVSHLPVFYQDKFTKFPELPGNSVS